MILIHYRDMEILGVSPEFFALWLGELCKSKDMVLGELSLVFCSDDALLEVNREYLSHDYYTDIITFDYTMGSVVSGDLMISVDRVRDNAKELNEMFHVELLRVVAHGVLHLLGYGDKSESEEKEMRNQESLALGLVSRETLESLKEL